MVLIVSISKGLFKQDSSVICFYLMVNLVLETWKEKTMRLQDIYLHN
jgi:hypothetical protein